MSLIRTFFIFFFSIIPSFLIRICVLCVNRVSLRDLHIVMPNYKEIDETEHLDILSGSLVYMCNKTTDNSSVDCYGIGRC